MRSKMTAPHNGLPIVFGRYPGFRAMHQEYLAKAAELDLVEGIFDPRFKQFNEAVEMLVNQKNSVQPEPDMHLSLCGASF